MKIKHEYTVLGVSAGIGVSLYPFRKHLVGNYEGRSIFHSKGDKQWRLNFKDIPLYRTIPTLFNGCRQQVDVIISSPDCGSGSILRLSRAKKLGDHKQNVSLAAFFEAIHVYWPKLFYFENLEGLFKSYPEREFNQILRNYRLVKHVASVSHWGNSQVSRKRLIIIGIRRDLPRKLKRCFKLPEVPELKQCWELMKHLEQREKPDICHVREKMDIPISIHAGKKLTPKQIALEWNSSRKDQKRWETPEYKFSSAPGVYRNLAEDYPATARKANRQFDHHGLMLTPRQLARIQGVPDKFKIHYEPDKSLYWINKGRAAVTKTPPYEISVWFKRKIEKHYKLWSTQPEN